MSAYPEGTPCWADAMFPDVEAAKSFYGEVLGWTFDSGSEEFGGYTQARSDGKAVAAVVPQMGGADGPAAWNLYFASPDAAATAAKIRDNGGTLAMEPVQVGDFGTMVTAQEPSGAYFSVWQPGSHEGFEKTGEAGAYCWAELTTRDPAAADAFLPSVFPFEVKKMDVDDVDFSVFEVGGQPVLGRLKMTEDFPPDVPPFLNVHFAVDNCDAAIVTVAKLGGHLLFGPMDSPFGRFATVADQQGATFSIIDLTTTEGEMPSFS
ncbi:VOC family protein [Streptomyces durmitorensis]|uniref:VOC family protein n=1 Tax=Streptomyces durmitorensis TaxID=319947 RepID=A0ABY4PLQ6_9ACTN|nr:VOC family protein [Streptomyces durmitorensis]UQT54728.1 VOC family protein [Streptomyces durmitorensis]